MFTHQSHSYILQVAALWCSFTPVFAILGLVVAAQVERVRRLH